MKKHFKALLVLLCFIMASALIGLVACKAKEPEPTTGIISGTTVDKDGDPLEGVEIYYSEEDFVESDENGNYEIRDISIGDITLTANLNGYAEEVKNITAKDFNKGTANVKIMMYEGKGTITGVVRMKGHLDVPVVGATVKVGSSTVLTDASGRYTVSDICMLSKPNMQVTCPGYEDYTKNNISVNNFKSGVYTLNIDLDQTDLEALPGLKPYTAFEREPLDSSLTTINWKDFEYHFDASLDGLHGQSKVETHGEGYCLNADTKDMCDTMVAFISTRLTVSENNKYVTVYARMFKGQNNESNGGPYYAQLGMYIFDEDKTFINDDKVANFTQITTESYMPVVFDLSNYIGKTITIVLGTKTGYHCCIDRITLTATLPKYLTVSEVDGLASLPIYDKVTDTSFDAAALKDKWHTGGPVRTIDEGFQINSGDPWKAVDYDSANPQPVNSYIYLTTDLTEEASTINITATIVNLEETKDPGQNNQQFLPYVCVILLDKNGNKLTQTAWTKIDVANNNDPYLLSYDFSQYVGEDVTVVIASNVGYRATITNVEFTSAAADSQD